MLLLLLLLLLISVILCKGEQYIFNNVTMTTVANKKTTIVTNAINNEILHGWRNLEFLQQNIPLLPTNSIANLTDLKRLIFINTNTNTIDSNAIHSVPKLKILIINDNPSLKQLPSNAFNCSALLILNLKRNGLEHLTSLEGIPKLQRLVLNGNRLKTIESTLFSNLNHLYDVHLTRNSLQEIPEGAFKSLKSPFNVYLDHNEISKFSELAFIDGAEIDTLIVSGNELEDFKAINNVKSVKWLELFDNDIECLDATVMGKVKVLMVDANPWSCDCLRNFTQRINGRFYANTELARCLFDE